ncbi:Cytochrome P450 4C1 [Pseudolycoriella hygida]|uniref:Cytochrome P450 4C1 n=1 Tax=Pseudolycoriella hygida TaxID=35572 RepID=A0A9Q0MRN3_9DIPT|nr:Cytochrome P450 4C1 [Pseudolycoriella hygida]
MLFIYLFCVVALILTLKFYLYKRRIMKYVGHLPAPPEIPFVGSGLYFIGKNSMEIMDLLCMTTDIFDTPCRFWLGPVLAIFLGKPEDVQTVLLSPHCLEKPYIYRFMDDVEGIFTAPIHKWKSQRKLLNPTFNNKILLSFVPIFNEKSQILADVLDKKVGQKNFDISKQLFACTLEMVCCTTIGCDLEFQSNKNVKMLETMEIQSELVANRMTRFWLHPFFIYRFTNDYKKFRDNTKFIYEIPRAIRKIKEKEFYEKKIFENNNELETEEFFSTPQIFVNELFKLHNQKLIDDRMLDDEILTILVGGNETTALTTSHVILMLAMHPDIQERAFQEIKSVHETQTSHTTTDILTKLNYLEMCIKETMRLYPVAQFLARQNLQEIKLSNCTVPKGTMLIMSFHHLHRNKEVWGPNADRFDPDNFLPEKIASRHAYSFLPFSAGPRNCIGYKYGWFAMKIILSAIMRRYKLSTHLRLEDIRTKFEVTLKIENRHLVTVERREEY